MEAPRPFFGEKYRAYEDKKTSIDQFYLKYDEEYSNRDLNERRFRGVIDTINETFDDTLREWAFSRPPLFYSLFGVIYHRQYGLPDVDLDTPRKELNKAERLSLVEAVQTASDLIDEVREGVPLGGRFEAFVNASLRQTDNIRPRQVRLWFLYERAFGR